MQEVLFKHKNVYYCDGGQMLEEIAQTLNSQRHLNLNFLSKKWLSSFKCISVLLYLLNILYVYTYTHVYIEILKISIYFEGVGILLFLAIHMTYIVFYSSR